MDLLGSILRALLPLFVLIGLGYALRRWSVLHRDHVPVLNGLVLNVLLPASILRALTMAPTLSLRAAVLPLLLILCECVTMAACYFAGTRAGLPRKLLGAGLLASAFGNTAFLGYPVAQALLPRQFPSTVLIDQFGMMMVLYPLAAVFGIWFASEKRAEAGAGDAIKRVLKGPLFISILVGLLLRSLPIPVSLAHQTWAVSAFGVISQCIGYLAQATTPVVLLALGVALEPKSSEGPKSALAAACGMKLLFCPLLMWALCHLAGIGGETRMATVLQAAMPAGVLTAVLSGQYGLSGTFAVRVVFASTALSLITIPLVLSLLR